MRIMNWMNVKRTTASLLVASAGLALGCENCDVEVDWEDYDDVHKDAMKCCNNKADGTPEGTAARDECLRNLQDKSSELANKIFDFQTACEAGNVEDQEELKGIIEGILRSICRGILVRTLSDNKNVVSPLREVAALSVTTTALNDVIIVDRLGRNNTARSSQAKKSNRFSGDFTIFSNQGGSGGGNVAGTIAWRNAPVAFSQSTQRRYVPTEFSMKLTGYLGEANFDLVADPDNVILINSGGGGVLKALVSIDAPGRIGLLTPEFWMEVPVQMGRNGIAVSFEGLSGNDVAPLAPDQLADWNSDLKVDMLDYAAFMVSLASNGADLTFDGASDSDDLAVFEESFYANFDG